MLGVVQLAGFVCILCSRPAVLGLNFKGNALLSLKNFAYVPCKGFSIAVIGQPVISRNEIKEPIVYNVYHHGVCARMPLVYLRRPLDKYCFKLGIQIGIRDISKMAGTGCHAF